jgi:nitroreductase
MTDVRQESASPAGDPEDHPAPRPRVPYDWRPYGVDGSRAAIQQDLEVARRRRSVREFASDPVPKEIIADAIRIAGTAPSGAHRQPWYFVAISDPETKARIRAAAEREERTFYTQRAPRAWLDALAPIGTDAVKAHITEAPWVVVLFKRDHDVAPDGTPQKNYYVHESVGIALGFFLQALHRAGLSCLTHTPSPMGFLREICGRPAREKPVVLVPVGYPAPGCTVPDLERKPLEEIAEFR